MPDLKGTGHSPRPVAIVFALRLKPNAGLDTVPDFQIRSLFPIKQDNV